MQTKSNQRFQTKRVEHIPVWRSEQRLTCRYSSRVIVPSLSVSCMLNKTAERNTETFHKCVDHRSFQARGNVTHISVSPSWRSHAAPQSCSVTAAWNGTWPPGTPQSWSPPLCPLHSDDSFWWKKGQISVLYFLFWYSRGNSTTVGTKYHHCTFCRRKLLWSVHGWDCMPSPGFHWSAPSWRRKRETHTVCIQLLPHVTSGVRQHEVKW